MARGGRRPGAGRPAKSVELHRLHDTFRPDRHGHRGSNAVPMPKPATGVDWWPLIPTSKRWGRGPGPGWKPR